MLAIGMQGQLALSKLMSGRLASSYGCECASLKPAEMQHYKFLAHALGSASATLHLQLLCVGHVSQPFVAQAWLAVHMRYSDAFKPHHLCCARLAGTYFL